MAFLVRSVKCQIINDSEHELSLLEEDHLHGSADVPPPLRLLPGETAGFGASTSGFMTGTEGRVSFTVGSTGGSFEIYWSNPFIGDNEFSQACTGVAAYQATQPSASDPETGEALDEDRKRGDDDVSVAFTFTTRPPDQSLASPDAQAESSLDNRLPKPTVASPGKSTHASDPVVVQRKIVYLGVNNVQSDREANELRSRVPAWDAGGRMEFLTAITESGHDPFVREYGKKTDEEWAQSIPTLPESQRLALLDALKGMKNLRTKHGGTNALSEASTPRFEVRALARVMAAAEDELRLIKNDEAFCIPTEAQPLRRLCISGHHRPRAALQGYPYFRGYVYGYTVYGRNDERNGKCQIHLFEDVKPLAQIFTAAAAQVEDLMLAACNTGWHKDTRNRWGEFALVPDLLSFFPNLQTVWAYENTAPGGATAATHLVTWERASRLPGASAAIHAAAQDLRSRGSAFPVVWVRSASELTLQPSSPQAPSPPMV
jgi:hypothetical protein